MSPLVEIGLADLPNHLLIPCNLGVLATLLLALSDDFKIIYGKFERNEVTFILNFDQFEVIFFGSEVGSLSFIFQF